MIGALGSMGSLGSLGLTNPLNKGGGVFNVAALPIWSAAVRDSIAGVANARLTWIGGSTVAGYSSLVDGSASGAWNNALPAKVSLLGRAKGLNARLNSRIGTHSFPGGPAFADDRQTFPSPWAEIAGTAGGAVMSSGASGTSVAVFSPTDPWNEVEVIGTINTTLGILEVLIDGVVVAEINSAGSAAMRRNVYTTTLGIHTVGVRRKSGGLISDIGFICRNSAVKEITTLNLGIYGSTSTNWNNSSAALSHLNAIKFYNPHLTVIGTGGPANDAPAGISTAQTKINLQAVYDAARFGGGDAIFMAQHRFGGAVSEATQATYAAAMKEVADANGALFIDIPALLGNFTTLKAAGALAPDDIHLNSVGVAMCANVVAPVIGFS